MSHDQKCRDLADHFLADSKGATNEDRQELAEALQETAEDFLRDMECCRTCGACAGFIGAECDETCEHAEKERDKLCAADERRAEGR